MASFMSMNSPGLMQASMLNNAAGSLERSGDFAGAERKYLEALQLKIAAAGENSIPVALTKNALGELYLTMNELDKAQTMLEAAERVRSGTKGQKFDAACSRDNLGRLWEMKGNLAKARSMRSKKNQEMICSHFDCPKSSSCQLSTLAGLNKCARCKCVFYCGKPCQTSDWKRHKQFCKVASEDVD